MKDQHSHGQDNFGLICEYHFLFGNSYKCFRRKILEKKKEGILIVIGAF